ncbi:unnamed protein product, partial [Meganyctiphanes norvegica]
ILSYNALSPVCDISGLLPGDTPCVVQVVTEQFLKPPDKRPYNFDNDNPYYKQYDKLMGMGTRNIIKTVFLNQPKGFFVEAGALDGVYASNSLELERDLGWTGLLVEPNPVSYKSLLTKHRKAWTTNACLSTTSYPKQTIFVAESDSNPHSEHAMNIKGGTHELGVNIDDFAVEKEAEDTKEKNYVNVQCFPLRSYLSALNITQVDLLSLDIQGAEKQVLDTLPWETVTFRLLIIENIHQGYDEQFVKDMENKSFRLAHWNKEDYIFMKQGDIHLDHFKIESNICNGRACSLNVKYS